MAIQAESWEFWIDVGGTFTDCLARLPDGSLRRHKLLSSGAWHGTIDRICEEDILDAALCSAPAGFWQGSDFTVEDPDGEIIFQAAVVDSQTQPGRLIVADPLPESVQTGLRYRLRHNSEAPIQAIRWLYGLAAHEAIPVCRVRLGTTRGTNALLTRNGAVTGLVTTEGFADLLKIGNQDRPHLFDLNARKPDPLFHSVVEVSERMSPEGEVVQPLDLDQARRQLEHVKSQGVESLAISLLNAYRSAAHEEQLATLAQDLGFVHVSISSEVAPLIKLVSRSQTTVLNAYLDPVLTEYLGRLQRELPADSTLRLLTSAGGLVSADGFAGKDSILSGPAGGVVGAAEVARQAGMGEIITLDMGGTSTDVSRFDGQFRYDYEAEKAGVPIVTPMMAIHTVAAGGGSICRFDGARLVVGPESAGADPGPACYGRGGPLTVTDVNLLLGRLRAESFPFPLDEAASRRRMTQLVEQLNASGENHAEDDVASGLLRIANASMVEAIRSISVAQGYDPRNHVLVCFGGAGGQHACEVARQLGIRKILNHPDAGILSALGMGVAPLSRHAQKGVYASLEDWPAERIESLVVRLEGEARENLETEEGVSQNDVRLTWSAEIRYQGLDAGLEIKSEAGQDRGRWIETLKPRFEESHQQHYGYLHPQKPLELIAVRVEAVARYEEGRIRTQPNEGDMVSKPLAPAPMDCLGSKCEARLLWRQALAKGDQLDGPAVVLEPRGTTVLDPGWRATVLEDGELLLEDNSPDLRPAPLGRPTRVDPATLEVLNRRFGGIAQQMGLTLQNTSSSVNVKERLDFSCALFTAQGDLVVNAPHIPVHLGAMGETVRAMIADHPEMSPGDVFVSNDPYRGGSHLPDITVVTPVFDESAGNDRHPIMFTANRAHHAEIGGTAPGSMPPFSSSLAEEGVLIRSFRLVEQGRWHGDRLRSMLLSAPYPTRNVEDNMADLRAQVAANRRGAKQIQLLLESRGSEEVTFYIQQVQRAAETKMRRALARLEDREYRFRDCLDDGTEIVVCVTVQGEEAHIDFAGTSGQVAGNLNANRAIVQAATMYVMRCLIDEDIPLNEGVLAPLTIQVPTGLLAPEPDDDPASSPAVAGGNVETSQRVVDVLLGALQLAAASQGTMNNLLFGNDSFGYYETICGGAGATADGPGESGVHTHMTNTRITDPEVLELRYPVRVREFSLRHGSGGQGVYDGGDGVVRRLEFLEDLELTILSQRRGPYAPFGLAGGTPGMTGENHLVRADGSEQLLAGRTRIQVCEGDCLTIRTPGGGGYGERPGE